MKIKSKSNESNTSVAKKTEVKPVVGQRLVEVWHTQDVKLSQNYQSASCSYGVKLSCPDKSEDIQAAMSRAEEIVESQLVAKIQQQKELLSKLS